MSFITAVILYKVLSLSFVSTDFPTTSVVPKYFFAADSQTTTVFGSFKSSFWIPVNYRESKYTK